MALLTQPHIDEVASPRGTITVPNSSAKPPDSVVTGENPALGADGGGSLQPHVAPPHQKRDHGNQPGTAQHHHRKDGPVSGSELLTLEAKDSASTDVLTPLHHHLCHHAHHTPDQLAGGGGPPSERGSQSMGNLGEITPFASHLHHAASVDVGSTCGDAAPSSKMGRSHSAMRSIQTFFKR